MGDGSLLTQVVLVLGASVSLISVSFVRGVLLLHGSTRFRTAPHCGVFSVFVMTVVPGAAFYVNVLFCVGGALGGLYSAPPLRTVV